MRCHLQEVRAADLAPSARPPLAATARLRRGARAANRRTRPRRPSRDPGPGRRWRAAERGSGAAVPGRGRPAPAWPGRREALGRGDREPEHDDDGERDVRDRALPSTDERATTTPRHVHPDARPLLPTSRSRPSLARDPLPPSSVSYSLLLLMLRPTPACRRPASGLPPSRLGCPARFIWQVEEGPSSAKRWTALPRKPRRDAGSRPEAGRRPRSLEGEPPRANHLQRTT